MSEALPIPHHRLSFQQGFHLIPARLAMQLLPQGQTSPLFLLKMFWRSLFSILQSRCRAHPMRSPFPASTSVSPQLFSFLRVPGSARPPLLGFRRNISCCTRLRTFSCNTSTFVRGCHGNPFRVFYRGKRYDNNQPIDYSGISAIIINFVSYPWRPLRVRVSLPC